jgi:hypothetical protein
MQQAFDRVEATCRGTYEQDHDELAESADCHSIAVRPDIFNDYDGLLIDCKKQARLIYQGPLLNLQETFLHRGEFDAAILATHKQLNAWYERGEPDVE